MANTNREPASRTFESTAAGTAGSSQAEPSASSASVAANDQAGDPPTSEGSPSSESPAPSGGTSSSPGEGAQPSAETATDTSGAEATPPASEANTGGTETAARGGTGEGSQPPAAGDTGGGIQISALGETILPVGDTDLGGGVLGDAISNPGETLGQTLTAIGSGGPLQPALDGSGLVDGLGLGGLVDTASQAVSGLVGGTPLQDVFNSTGLLNGQNLGAVGDLADTAVSGATQAVDAIANDGSVSDLLNGAGSDIGSLANSALNDLAGATGSGLVGSVVNGIGGDLATGTLGGAGLLSGTPLAGIQGDGALISGNLLRANDSSSPSLTQAGAGTDQSQGLIDLTAAGDHNAPASNNLIDSNMGPNSSDSDVNASLLGATPDSSGALVNADAGQTQGYLLATVNAANNADQFQFPALDGIGTDALVGEVGQLPGDPLGSVGGDALPASATADGNVLADIGATGTLDAGENQLANDGTHVTVDTPLHSALL
jgi:hypothetical protein